MLKLESHEYVYMNSKTLEVTDTADSDAIEFVHFFLKGQSFLYNQIRKMIGIIIQVFRGGHDDEFMERTFKDNTFSVALAPGDGLLLEKVCYEMYNKKIVNKKTDIMLTYTH